MGFSFSPLVTTMLALIGVAVLSFIWLMLRNRGRNDYSFFVLQGQILDKQWGAALPGILFVVAVLGLIFSLAPFFWSRGWTWIAVIWSLLSFWIILNLWANFRRGAAQRKRKQEKANIDPYSAEAFIRQRRKANKRRKR